MSGTRVELSIVEGLARLRLVNPEGRNAIDLVFCREFSEAAFACASDPDVRTVLVEATGDVFSVGGDLREFVAQRQRLERHVLEMASLFHVGIARLRHGPAPVLVALNGIAAGGGLSLVCAADLAIAKRSARLVCAYTRSGLTPDGGLTYFLPRIVGLRRAFDLMATNPTLTADEALALGIVSRVVDDDEFEDEVERLAREISDAPRDVLVTLKALLRSSLASSLAEQLEAEAVAISRRAAHPDTLAKLVGFLGRSKR